MFCLTSNDKVWALVWQQVPDLICQIIMTGSAVIMFLHRKLLLTDTKDNLVCKHGIM